MTIKVEEAHQGSVMTVNLRPAAGKTRDTRTEERTVGLVLRIGAYASVVLILAGGIVSLIHADAGHHIIEAGVLVLMCTPISRVLTAAIVFWREGDRHYAWISI